MNKDKTKEELIQQLQTLEPIFTNAMRGEYSEDVDIPEEEDELSFLFVGIQMMIDSIRSKIKSYEALNKKLEARISRRTTILQTVNEIAKILLTARSWENHMDDILEKLGRTVDVSRAYLFKKISEDENEIYMSQLNEWVNKGIEPQIDNPQLQNTPMKEMGFSRWMTKFFNKEVVHGSIGDFPADEQDFLKSQDILSLVVIPIFVDEKWWGFIGFDECVDESREWTDAEIAPLSFSASLIGSAISRQVAQEDLSERQEELKKLNQMMVGREVRMAELKQRIKQLEEKH